MNCSGNKPIFTQMWLHQTNIYTIFCNAKYSQWRRGFGYRGTAFFILSKSDFISGIFSSLKTWLVDQWIEAASCVYANFRVFPGFAQPFFDRGKFGMEFHHVPRSENRTQGEKTAVQAVVGSIVWAFRRLKKAKVSGDERPRLRAS